MEAAEHKKCSHCKEMLPPIAFAANRSRVDGRQPECRKCRNSLQAKYRQAKGIRSRQELNADMNRGWSLPSPPDLSVQLLHLHMKRPYGATPGAALRGSL